MRTEWWLEGTEETCELTGGWFQLSPVLDDSAAKTVTLDPAAGTRIRLLVDGRLAPERWREFVARHQNGSVRLCCRITFPDGRVQLNKLAWEEELNAFVPDYGQGVEG